ncbi:MAG TPA: putative maltokinase [Chloroflexia bacterium]|nr:putative maltokinase [Chloroflexia bacterium]
MDNTTPSGVSLDLHDDTNRRAIERELPGYISTRRWFGGKARTIREVRFVDSLAIVHGESHRTYIAIAEVAYEDGDSQRYVLPLNVVLASEIGAEALTAHGLIATWQVDAAAVRRTLIATDAIFDADFASGLLDAVATGHRWAGERGDIVAWSTPELASLAPAGTDLTPSVLGTEQSNTSILYGQALILKLFRRLEEGTSPELEIGRALQTANFAETPPLGGALEYVQPGGEPLTLAVLQGYVPNRGDAWGYTIETLVDYFRSALEGTPDTRLAEVPTPDLIELSRHSAPEGLDDVSVGYLRSAAQLGRTTARMHLALARVGGGPAFEPEPLDIEHREHMYAAMRLLADEAFGLLRARQGEILPDARDEAADVLARSETIERHFSPLIGSDTGGLRTRVHGDYHLGQVLYTGGEFYIIDFEGEPVRNLADRRRKHSPLKDVAGMVRSFHYAAYSGLFNHGRAHNRKVAGDRDAERWADAWYYWTSAAFLREYLATTEGSGLLPEGEDGLRVLLSAYLLEKAVYELVYEMNNRPTWVAIPLKGISALLS